MPQAEALTPGGCRGDPQQARNSGGSQSSMRVSLQKDTLPYCLGFCQPAGSQVVAHLLGEFHGSRRTSGSPGRHSDGGLCGPNPGHADPKGPGSGSSPGPWRPLWHAGLYPTHLGTARAPPGSRSCCAGLASSRDAGHPCTSWPIREERGYILQGYLVTVEIEVQREVGVSILQTQVDQAVGGGLHLMESF